MAARRRAGRADGELPRSGHTARGRHLTVAIEPLPARRTGSVVCARGGAPLEGAQLLDPLRGRLRARVRAPGRRGAGLCGTAETVRQIRLEVAPRKDAADCLWPTEWVGRKATATWQLRLSRLHPLLGSESERILDREAQDSAQATESGAETNQRMVSGQPPSARGAAASYLGDETERALPLLRDNRQWASAWTISARGGTTVAQVAESAESESWATAVGSTAALADDEVGAAASAYCSLDLRSKDRGLKNRMRELRSYGSVGGAGGKPPALPGNLIVAASIRTVDYNNGPSNRFALSMSLICCGPLISRSMVSAPR